MRLSFLFDDRILHKPQETEHRGANLGVDYKPAENRGAIRASYQYVSDFLPVGLCHDDVEKISARFWNPL